MNPKSPQEIAQEIVKYTPCVEGNEYLLINDIAQAIEAERSRAKILEDALEFYANAEHVMKESAPNPANVCPAYGHYAREALAKFRGGV